MKENWIKKIIELLNEAIRNWLDFQWNDIIKIKYYSETDIRAYYDKTARAYYNITYEDIISKRAGFIKRLVDNNKIDLDKAYLENCCMCWWFLRYGEVDGLIMKLSIRNNPIEYLTTILK